LPGDALVGRYNAAMTASPLNWKPLAGRTLEAALNRALALDPDTRDGLVPLEGRRVALTVESPALALQVRVEGQRLVVGPVDADVPPDLGVRGTLGGLLAQLPMFRRDDAPPVGRMRVEGDADLARRLQRLAERFDPDWQRPFARVFGDVLGVQIANAFAAALKQARLSGRNLAETAAEFVTEESRDVVARAELNAFHDDVDVLRDDVERLGARIARLHAKATQADSGRA
jgi:ubiquinone biosynthesis protein UbiJ